MYKQIKHASILILFLLASFVLGNTCYSITIDPIDPTIPKDDAADILAAALAASASGVVITDASLSDPTFGGFGFLPGDKRHFY